MDPTTTRPSRPPRRQKPELHSSDIPVQQDDPIGLDLDEELPELPKVEPVDRPLDKEQAAALAFMEEPVTVIIQPNDDPEASMLSDYCAVNGKRAEILVDGRWVESSGYLPRGVPLTLKRKYVEALARPKTTRVTTEVQEHPGQPPRNLLHRRTSVACHLQILHDPAGGKGVEWFKRLVAVNY